MSKVKTLFLDFEEDIHGDLYDLLSDAIRHKLDREGIDTMYTDNWKISFEITEE